MNTAFKKGDLVRYIGYLSRQRQGERVNWNKDLLVGDIGIVVDIRYSGKPPFDHNSNDFTDLELYVVCQRSSKKSRVPGPHFQRLTKCLTKKANWSNTTGTTPFIDAIPPVNAHSSSNLARWEQLQKLLQTEKVSS